MEKKETKPDKKRQLHDINERIYQISDDLNKIDVPGGLGLTQLHLRNATTDIQKSIGNIIDDEAKKAKELQEAKNENQITES